MSMFSTPPDLGYDLHVGGVNSYEPVKEHATVDEIDQKGYKRTLLMYTDGHRQIGLIGKAVDLRAVLNFWLAELDEAGS